MVMDEYDFHENALLRLRTAGTLVYVVGDTKLNRRVAACRKFGI